METRDDGSGIRCNEHPDAPHGFMRDASHSAGRYVCECESWEPPKNKPMTRDEWYASPPKKELTCVCGAVWEGEHMVHAPPKREWVGLNHFDRTLLRTTHAPSKQIYHDKNNSVCVEVVSDWDVFFDAIEAKLKEKNHG